MKKFEIGKQYTMHSPCDQDCTWSYLVTGRTAHTITLRAENGWEQKCRVRESAILGAEACTPLGRYSMSPILSADRTK